MATSHIFNIPFARVKGRGEDEGELSRVERGEGGGEVSFPAPIPGALQQLYRGGCEISKKFAGRGRFPPISTG